MAEGRATSAGFTGGQKNRMNAALKTGLYSQRQATRIGSGTLARDKKREAKLKRK